MTTYRINEIFYSLQGEGVYTGVPMVFVRFAGCNLRCPFCDTQHEAYTLLTAEAIRAAVAQYPSTTVCLTGGEPTLQLTEELIAQAFSGYEVHLETNGTHAVPRGVDWVTLSPKAAPVVLTRCEELKLLYGEGVTSPEAWASFPARYHCLQPVEVAGNAEATRRNVRETIAYVQQHPSWRLSLQTHKIIGVR